MRGLQVWSEGRKRRVGAGLKGLPRVARGGKHGKAAAAAAAAAAAMTREGGWFDGAINVNESTLQDFGAEISLGGVLLPLSVVRATRQLNAFGFSETP